MDIRQHIHLLNNDNFRKIFPDNFEGFINYITQDENGGIIQKYRMFNEILHIIYYHMTPEQFCNQYEYFVNHLDPSERFHRKFLHNNNNQTIQNCIERIYIKTRDSHANPQDNRDPRFVFVLNIWFELWN